MRKVNEIIKEVRDQILVNRIEKLEFYGAPSIIINKSKEVLNSAPKVSGLLRKYKELQEAEVKNYEVYNGKTNTYRKGMKDTVVIRFELEQGTFYYDYYENKFGKEIEMTCTIK